ncbi:hypothetical protein GW17_00047834 [Ensete ventricosum]|nr:hypothetical protein GW17_00047834 [Ensete ventricosum]
MSRSNIDPRQPGNYEPSPRTTCAPCRKRRFRRARPRHLSCKHGHGGDHPTAGKPPAWPRLERRPPSLLLRWLVEQQSSRARFEDGSHGFAFTFTFTFVFASYVAAGATRSWMRDGGDGARRGAGPGAPCRTIGGRRGRRGPVCASSLVVVSTQSWSSVGWVEPQGPAWEVGRTIADSSMPVSGRLPRVGSATLAGQLSEGARTWQPGQYLSYHSPPEKTFSRFPIRVLKMRSCVVPSACGEVRLVPKVG